MDLTNEDVREILRIIDESNLDELRIETAGFKLHVRRGGAPTPPIGPPDAPQPSRSAAESIDGPAATVTAPMLGIFYRAAGPTEPSFVEVGTRVEPDSVIGLVEVMKLMNSVPAGVGGEVVEILAENGKMVEFGQPLIRIATDR